MISNIIKPKAHHSFYYSVNEVLLGYLLLITPIVIFVSLTIGLVPNVPYVDDYDAILHFNNNFNKSSSLFEKTNAIFAQHNEHRIVLTRLLTVISSAIFGSLRFDILIWLGVFFLAMAILVLYKSIASNSLNGSSLGYTQAALVLLPVVLFAFSTRALESFVWSTVVLANCSVLFFAILTIYFLTRSKLSLWSCTVCGLITLVCQGNGLVIVPVGVLILTLRGQWKTLAIWSLLMLIGVGLYFWGYKSNPGHPSVIDSLPHVSRNFWYTVYFIGSSAAASDEKQALIYGLSAYACLVWLIYKYIWVRYPTIFGAIIFILGSIWINALSRSEFGLSYAVTQNRYCLYSALFLGLVITGILLTLESRLRLIVTTSAVVLSLIYSVYSYYTTLPNWYQHRARLLNGLRVWAATGVGLAYPWQDRSNAILTESVEANTFVLPNRAKRVWDKKHPGSKL